MIAPLHAVKTAASVIQTAPRTLPGSIDHQCRILRVDCANPCGTPAPSDQTGAEPARAKARYHPHAAPFHQRADDRRRARISRLRRLSHRKAARLDIRTKFLKARTIDSRGGWRMTRTTDRTGRWRMPVAPPFTPRKAYKSLYLFLADRSEEHTSELQ